MVEILKQTGITKEIGWLYYLGPDGNIWRSKMAKGSNPGGQKEKVADAGIQRESGWLYFINKNGDVARSPMSRTRTPSPKKDNQKDNEKIIKKISSPNATINDLLDAINHSDPKVNLSAKNSTIFKKLISKGFNRFADPETQKVIVKINAKGFLETV